MGKDSQNTLTGKKNKTSELKQGEKSLKAMAPKIAIFSFVSYLVGIQVSLSFVPADLLINAESSGEGVARATMETQSGPTEKLSKELDRLLGVNEFGDPFLGVSLAIHRNGESEPCGTSLESKGMMSAFYESISSIPQKKATTKYHVDALLTKVFGSHMLSSDTCEPVEYRHSGKNDPAKRVPVSDIDPKIPNFFQYCDMGKDKTPIQPDHQRYIPVSSEFHEKSLPCHFYTREGDRIQDLGHLAELARDAAKAKDDNILSCEVDESGEQVCKPNTNRPTLHLYAVQAGRKFMFAPSYVGEIFELSEKNGDLPISLEVLSVAPKVFDIHNFFTPVEAKEVVDKVLNEKSESHKMKRSSTGASGYNLNSKRTSENGFDTHGKRAMIIKKRCFSVLGFDEYIESLADGLQVLRYNKTTAYIPHLDWIDDDFKREEHDFESLGVGSNRFATILLYMSDLKETSGGETVFSLAPPGNTSPSEMVSKGRAVKMLRESGDVSGILKEGSWEEDMVATCRTRLATKPYSGRAVLFYSQHPDGARDRMSVHGGCPVLEGEKWAANLWVWNAPRLGYPLAPKNQEVVEKNKKKNKGKAAPAGPEQLKATFHNSGNNPEFKNAQLFFQETFWSDLSFGSVTQHINTFEGHQWNIKVGDEVKRTIIIDKRKTQRYMI